MLRDIAQRISAGDAGTLTKPDTLIWNTAVVVSFMTGDGRIAVPHDAKVLNRGAARAGFREMELPDLAEFVRLFVLELAYRADLDGRDGQENSASLLRIAELKKRLLIELPWTRALAPSPNCLTGRSRRFLPRLEARVQMPSPAPVFQKLS